jgi:hypothetical protein
LHSRFRLQSSLFCGETLLAELWRGNPPEFRGRTLESRVRSRARRSALAVASTVAWGCSASKWGGPLFTHSNESTGSRRNSVEVRAVPAACALNDCRLQRPMALAPLLGVCDSNCDDGYEESILHCIWIFFMARNIYERCAALAWTHPYDVLSE